MTAGGGENGRDGGGGPETSSPTAASNVTALPANVHAHHPERRENLRIVEALLFAASEPMDEAALARHVRGNDSIASVIDELKSTYGARGINLIRVAGKWAFRTAEDLSYLLERHAKEERKLSRAAMETMAIIAYHQPVTRSEIEEIRGVATSAGTLDVLMETGWVRPRGRRRAPGRPITYGTTGAFLEHFNLDQIRDLPGLAELKGAGLLDSSLPPEFAVPEPTDVAALLPDELPLDAEEEPELPLDADAAPDIDRLPDPDTMSDDEAKSQQLKPTEITSEDDDQ